MECTIYDVITVANLATENNIFYELSSSTNGKDNYISVSLKGNSIEYGYGTSSTSINNKYNELIQNDIDKIQNDTQNQLPRYTCTVEISPTTQRVYKVEFK